MSDARPASASRPWVVKIGGALCDDPVARAALARACRGHPTPLVLVHGGGLSLTRVQQALGERPRFVEGRRVTDARSLETADMVLSGATNHALVRALTAAGRPAVGLSGCDAALVRCALVPQLGRVGAPVEIKPFVLHLLLGAGYTPVISPISLGPDGEAVNVNADEVACALAVALRAPRLLLLSDVSGVQVEDELRADVAEDEVESLIVARHVTGGMVPKLRAAAAAIASGVDEVLIAGYAGGPLRAVVGTRIRAATAASAGEGASYA